MLNKQPIIPFPPQSSSPSPEEIKRWITEVTVYLRTLNTIDTITAPPIVLASRQQDDRAAIDGILLYDRATSKPIISIGGKWYPFTIGAPL